MMVLRLSLLLGRRFSVYRKRKIWEAASHKHSVSPRICPELSPVCVRIVNQSCKPETLRSHDYLINRRPIWKTPNRFKDPDDEPLLSVWRTSRPNRTGWPRHSVSDINRSLDSSTDQTRNTLSVAQRSKQSASRRKLKLRSANQLRLRACAALVRDCYFRPPRPNFHDPDHTALSSSTIGSCRRGQRY